MALKLWLRISILSLFFLAGCVQPTPTPTETPGAGGAYPGAAPTSTSLPGGYPADQATPAAPQTTQPYPAPTSGAVAHLVPL